MPTSDQLSQATAKADPTRLYPLISLLHSYALQPGVALAEIDAEGFWDTLAKRLIPGDVIFITAKLPDGSTAVLIRAVAETEPNVRVRKPR